MYASSSRLIRASAPLRLPKRQSKSWPRPDRHRPSSARRSQAGVPERPRRSQPRPTRVPLSVQITLCGAAVAFKLAHALLLAHTAACSADPAGQADLRRLNERILLPSFLKLVSIATIADSVPLVRVKTELSRRSASSAARQPGAARSSRATCASPIIPLDRSPYRHRSWIPHRTSHQRRREDGHCRRRDRAVLSHARLQRATELAAEAQSTESRTSPRRRNAAALEEIEKRLAEILMREHESRLSLLKTIVLDHADMASRRRRYSRLAGSLTGQAAPRL